ncbi:MAG: VCBS repeat-containing protein, partial [Bacteroidaceae bacterium]|nr:VCBS repeat-containing protein [Bacteroidaceae bacterium]
MCKSPSTETGRCKASLSYSLVWVILSALSLLSLSANAQTAMTGISISPASQTVVADDEAEACFEISIIPQGADGSDVSSAQVTLSNPDVASIEGRKIERTIVSNLQSGQPYYMKLRPLKDGETDIEVTVTMNDETGFSATAKLIVEPKPVKHVTGIKFDTNWMDVTNTWDWWELKGTVTPFEPDNCKIHISMSNPIIELDNTEINVYTEWHDGEDRSRFNVFWTEKNQGRPEFLSYGITKVTATTDDGGFTAECIINRPANAQIDGFHQVYFRDIYGNELAHETIKDGDAAIAPLSRLPEVNGREFLGWSDDFSHVTSDMEIYAMYSANAEMIDKPLVHFPDATMFYDYDGYGFKGAVDADGCTLIGDFSKNFSKAGEIDGLNIWSDVGGMYFIDDINADGKPDYFIRVDGNMGSRSYTTLVSEGNKYSWQEGVYIVPGMDLNSDGRIDHLRYGNGWYVCYAQPDGSFREEFMQIMSASEYESSFDPDAWASTAIRTQSGLVANYGYVSGLSAVCLARAPMRSTSRTGETQPAPMRYDEVPAPTHCIDLNADGRMDLIDENQGIVYFNMGNAKWVVQSVGGSVLSADLNGDGFMDYVLPGEELVTMIYKNGGEFSTQTLYENIQVDKDMYCYDFDNDGDVDILVTFSAPYNATGFAYTMFFVNDGSGNFTQLDEQDYGDNLLVFKACQDADGDGIMDLVALRGTF